MGVHDLQQPYGSLGCTKQKKDLGGRRGVVTPDSCKCRFGPPLAPNTPSQSRCRYISKNVLFRKTRGGSKERGEQGRSYLDDWNPGFEPRRQLVENFGQQVLMFQRFAHFHDSHNRSLTQ